MLNFSLKFCNFPIDKKSKSGFKIRQIFRSGGAVLAKMSGPERSGGAVPSKKFGAEISENFDFLVFFMKFSRKIAQKGLILLKTRYVSKNLRGAERSGGAEFQN